MLLYTLPPHPIPSDQECPTFAPAVNPNVERVTPTLTLTLTLILILILTLTRTKHPITTLTLTLCCRRYLLSEISSQEQLSPEQMSDHPDQTRLLFYDSRLLHQQNNVNLRIRTTPQEDNSPPYRFWSWWVVLFRGSGPSGELSWWGIVLGIVVLVDLITLLSDYLVACQFKSFSSFSQMLKMWTGDWTGVTRRRVPSSSPARASPTSSATSPELPGRCSLTSRS